MLIRPLIYIYFPLNFHLIQNLRLNFPKMTKYSPCSTCEKDRQQIDQYIFHIFFHEWYKIKESKWCLFGNFISFNSVFQTCILRIESIYSETDKLSSELGKYPSRPRSRKRGTLTWKFVCVWVPVLSILIAYLVTYFVISIFSCE